MKKMLAILLTLSLLMTAVAALAEDNGSVQNQTPAANGPGPFPGGGRPEDMPEPPTGEKPEDAPEPPTGEKPDAAHEKPTGEKTEDAPAEPEDSQTNGEKPNAAPASPDGGNTNNRKPGGGMPVGQVPEGQAPEMPDWDKLVTEGVISEETAAKLKAYMEENMPENMMEKPDGEKTADPPQKPEDGKPDGEEPVNPNLEMVNQLLEAGILTQDEADAVSAWITENMPMNPAAEANG